MAATAVILAAVMGIAFFRMINRPWLIGSWTSSSCEEMGGEAAPYFIKREFIFTNNSFQRTTHFFTDKNCTDAFASTEFSGNYKSLGPEYISLETKHMQLKAESSAVAQVFSQNRCGDGDWSVNVSQDVTQNGCLDFADKNLISTEQNFQTKKEDDQLFLGDQKNPLTRTSD